MLVLVAALAAVWAGPAQPAHAHAQLLSSDPANGARLATAPTRITLVFSERLTLLAKGGVRVAGPRGPVDPAGPVRADPGRPERLSVPLPGGLGPGVYTVTWRVVSADSHPVHGTFVFGVGDADMGELPEAGALTGADASVSVVFAGFRWLGYAALGLLAGGTGFLLVCWPEGWAHRRARRLLAAAWTGSVVCAVAVLLLQGPYAAGSGLAGVLDPEPLSGTLSTAYGRYVLARIGLLLAGGAFVLRLLRGFGAARNRPLGVAAGLTLLVALPATWVGTGHANVDPSPLSVAAGTLHVAAMAAWPGGLAFLLRVLRRTEPPPVAEVGAALNRFSRIATGSVAALAVTGLYRAWREVGSVAALTGSPYGKLLILKLAAGVVLVWSGAVSRSVVRRRYAPRATAVPTAGLVASGAPAVHRRVRGGGRAARERDASARRQLRLSLRIEVVFAAAVLAFTAVLVATPPGSRQDASQAAARRVQLRLADQGLADVVLDPARAGASSLTVAVRDRRGRARDVPEVSATLTLPAAGLGPVPVPLARRGPGRYRAQKLIVPRAGTWLLRLSVRSSDIDQETVETELPVG